MWVVVEEPWRGGWVRGRVMGLGFWGLRHRRCLFRSCWGGAVGTSGHVVRDFHGRVPVRHGTPSFSVWSASNWLHFLLIEPYIFKGRYQGRIHLYGAAVVKRDSAILGNWLRRW